MIEALDQARERLRDAGVGPARIGRLVEHHGLLAAVRPARVVPHAEAWPLGVILLGAAPGPLRVWATGEAVRAREPDRRGYPAESQRRRGMLAEAARRGGFAAGETAHLAAAELDLAGIAAGAAAGPLAVVDGAPVVRWSPGAPPAPLEPYLRERVDLLIHPPERA